MTDTVGVVIGTYGSFATWKPLARRALDSAANQTLPPQDVVWMHRDSLQAARNEGAEALQTDWLIFLDADDELDVRYIEQMMEMPRGDVMVPRTVGVYEDGTEDAIPTRIPWRDLRIANFVVIGAMQRRVVFEAVGGFPDYPILEDWALWRKMAAAGAQFFESEAVYRIHVRAASRNTDHDLHRSVYRQILSEVPLS